MEGRKHLIPSLCMSARQTSVCVGVPTGEAPHDDDGKDSGAPQRERAGVTAALTGIFELYTAMLFRNEKECCFPQDEKGSSQSTVEKNALPLFY